MKVKELIEELSKLDGNKDVAFYNEQRAGTGLYEGALFQNEGTVFLAYSKPVEIESDYVEQEREAQCNKCGAPTSKFQNPKYCDRCAK